MAKQLHLARAVGTATLASVLLVSCKDIRIPTSVSDVITSPGIACGDIEFTLSYRNEYPLDTTSPPYQIVRKFYDISASYGGNGIFKNVAMSMQPGSAGGPAPLIELAASGQALGIPWTTQTQPVTGKKFTMNGLRTSTVTAWGSGFGSTPIGTLVFDAIETDGSTAPVPPEALKLAFYGATPKELTECATPPIELANPKESVDYYIPSFRLDPDFVTQPDFSGWQFNPLSDDVWLTSGLLSIPTQNTLGYEIAPVFDDPAINYRRVIKFIDQNNWNGSEYLGDIDADILSFATTNYVADPNDWAANGVVYSSKGATVSFTGMSIPGYLPGPYGCRF